MGLEEDTRTIHNNTLPFSVKVPSQLPLGEIEFKHIPCASLDCTVSICFYTNRSVKFYKMYLWELNDKFVSSEHKIYAVSEHNPYNPNGHDVEDPSDPIGAHIDIYDGAGNYEKIDVNMDGKRILDSTIAMKYIRELLVTRPQNYMHSNYTSSNSRSQILLVLYNIILRYE